VTGILELEIYMVGFMSMIPFPEFSVFTDIFGSAVLNLGGDMEGFNKGT